MTNSTLVKFGGVAVFLVAVVLIVLAMSGNVKVAVNPAVASADGGYGPNTVYPTATNSTKEPKVGASSAPALLNGCQDMGGTLECFYDSVWSQATSSVCAFKLPNATSTLIMATAQIKNMQGTANVGEWGYTRFNDFATTTSLGYGLLSATVQTTLSASTTGAVSPANAAYATLPPGGWLLFKTGSSTPTGVTGRCSAQIQTQ